MEYLCMLLDDYFTVRRAASTFTPHCPLLAISSRALAFVQPRISTCFMLILLSHHFWRHSLSFSLSPADIFHVLCFPLFFFCSILEMSAGDSNQPPVMTEGTKLEVPRRTPRRSAIELIQRIYETYPVETIGVSFNGGKDSVVMIELIKEAVGIDALRQSVVFFLDTCDDFPEMSAFRDRFEREQLPAVKVHHVRAEKGLCDGLWQIKNTFNIDAVMMGTRCTDPSGKYQRGECEPTTKGWAPMMRVCPVFYWSVHDVWSFIHDKGVPFCALYLQGYTSLGSPLATSPNNALRQEDGSFAPAWTLQNDEHERVGRLSQTDSNCSPMSP